MTHFFSSTIEEQMHDHATDNLIGAVMGLLSQASRQGVCLSCTIPELVTHLSDYYTETHGAEAAQSMLEMAQDWVTDAPIEVPTQWHQVPAH